MNFDLDDGQLRRRGEVLAAATDLTGPAEKECFSRRDWARLADMGLLGSAVPAEYGGAGLGALDTALMFEAAGEGCADTGLLFAAAAHLFAATLPVVKFADPRTRRLLVPDLVAGASIAANAMTEDEAGSDVGNLATTAARVKGGYLLNGHKSFVSNGPVADVYVTYAITDPEAGHLGGTAFVVDRSLPGLTAGPAMDKIGLSSCPAGTVTFENCFVSDDRVLGHRGQGGLIFQTSMHWERACLFALYVGLQERLVQQCAAHLRQRRQFGRRLAEFQSVTHRVVDMKLRLESGRLLLYRACAEIDSGRDPAMWVAMAKLAISEAAIATALDAAHIFGGRGYLRDHGIEVAIRDAAPATTFSGTSDIQRQLMARGLGL